LVVSRALKPKMALPYIPVPVEGVQWWVALGVMFLIYAVPIYRWLRGYKKRWRDRDPY
jgi:drug/metabolite transporter (DMT)-like permease